MKPIKKRIRKPSEIVESLSAASSRLGVELHHVQAAKKAGCVAFKPGGRVHLGELKEHFDKNPVSRASLPPLTDEQVAVQGDIEESLKGAIRDEIEIDRDLQHARATGNSGAVADLILAMGRARKTRLAIEAAVTKLQRERGELLTVDQAKIQISKLHVPTVTLLRKLPRTVASKVVLGDDIAAEKILAEAVEELISELRRSLQGEPDPDFHLTVFKAIILHDHGAAKLIELLEAAKQEVIAETSEDSTIQQAEKPAPVEPEKAPVISEF